MFLALQYTPCNVNTNVFVAVGVGGGGGDDRKHVHCRMLTDKVEKSFDKPL